MDLNLEILMNDIIDEFSWMKSDDTLSLDQSVGDNDNIEESDIVNDINLFINSKETALTDKLKYSTYNTWLDPSTILFHIETDAKEKYSCNFTRNSITKQQKISIVLHDWGGEFYNFIQFTNKTHYTHDSIFGMENL